MIKWIKVNGTYYNINQISSVDIINKDDEHVCLTFTMSNGEVVMKDKYPQRSVNKLYSVLGMSE